MDASTVHSYETCQLKVLSAHELRMHFDGALLICLKLRAIRIEKSPRLVRYRWPQLYASCSYVCMWEEETWRIYIIIIWGNVLDRVPSDYIYADLKLVICNKAKMSFWDIIQNYQDVLCLFLKKKYIIIPSLCTFSFPPFSIYFLLGMRVRMYSNWWQLKIVNVD